MSFSSLHFLIFFLLIFIAYFSVARNKQWQLLLLASVYFYFSSSIAYGLILLLSIIVSYYCARFINTFPLHKKKILTISILILVGILVIFKYYNFFSFTANDIFALLKINLSLPSFKILLPLGLSFFTFQTIGYVADVYQGKIKPETNFYKYALFVSFFPTISAGPIERAGHLLPQFKQKHVFSYSETVNGLQLFTLGLFKKIVIADNLSVIVDSVFLNLHDFKGLSLIIMIFLFSWQIYYDFAGYTDMVRGIAKVLGFDLLENFKTPYFATSIGNFWRRWHISLSTWIKDYLYIPLGGNRRGLLKTVLNTLIVFVVCGIWHGAGWNFIIWGGLHGLWLSVERIFTKFNNQRIVFPKLVSILTTYSLVSFSWIFFRAPSIADATYIIRFALVGLKNFFNPNYVWSTLSQLFETNKIEMGIVAFCIASVCVIELLAYRYGEKFQLRKLAWLPRWAIYVLAVTAIMLLRNASVAQFIYVRF